jgi:hypothetical protein
MYKTQHTVAKWITAIVMIVCMYALVVDYTNPRVTIATMVSMFVMYYVHEVIKLNTSPKRRTVRNSQKKLTGVVYFRPKFNVN